MTRTQKRAVEQQENTIVMPPLSQSEIADRAYSLFLRRGSAHGADLEDWLQAEQELLQERNAAEAA